MHSQSQTRPAIFKNRWAIRSGSVATVSLLISCTATVGQNPAQSPSGVATSTFAENPSNFRLSLTDAPNDDLKSVFVNVKHAELRLNRGGDEARVIVAENLGLVDLLSLQNGVTLPMADLQIPELVTVTQIRLVLDDQGNHIIKSDGSRCDLKTPSAQKTGVKLLIHKGVTVEKGYSYSVVADFDAKKSVVLTGNGGCLLKPVIKLKSATRIELPPPPEDNGGGDVEPTPTPVPTPIPSSDDSSGEEPVVNDDGASQEDDGSGFDSGTDDSVPVVPADDLNEYFSDNF